MAEETLEGMLDPERGSLNKWEMYKALRSQDIGPCRLPFTVPWHPQTLSQLLDRYHQLYLKPVDTWGGQGISLIAKSDHGYRWTPQGAAPRHFPSKSALCAELAQVYPIHRAVAQQAAPLLRVDGRVFDIRVLMQREVDDRWVFAGSLCRVAGDDSIVSNVGASQGTVRPVTDVLAKALPKKNRSPRNIRLILNRLEQCSGKICAVLDRYRYFHEAGLDFGVDPLGRLWLIEVNTDDALGGPSHELFAELPDRTLYEEIQQRTERHKQQTIAWVLGALFTREAEEPEP